MSEQVVGGRYRLQQQLGRGGTASVWRARDTRLDRSAAVKLLDPTWRDDPVALERLRREAHSVAGLAHRNIVGVYDFDVADDAAYLVMELVPGRSLTELLAAQGPMPVEEAVSIAAQICDALGAAHAAGVVHRDIKPSNILVTSTGVAKVCDFGIARLQMAAGHAALTGTGAVVGTCQYMAPEQAEGKRVDGRSDLYAVGCVLYMMLVGSPPFGGANAMDVLDQHVNEPPVPLRAYRDDVPPALRGLITELLAKDRADRPATAWSVRDRLAAIGGRLAASSSGTNPPIRGRSAAEGWPAEPTVVSPVVASAPVTVTSEDDHTVGHHRSTRVATPVVAWLGRWVSGWVLILVAAALVSVVVATIVLVGSSRPDTSISAPSTSAATPDAAAAPAEPTESLDPSPPTPSKSPSPSAAATTSPARARPIDQIVGLAAILQRQADDGQLQRKAARTLLRDLNEVARRLSDGESAEAADRFDEFRDRVRTLRSDGKLTGPLPDLDRIAESLHRG